MSAKKKRYTLAVVTDLQGNVLGASLPAGDQEMRTGMLALEGQRVHEVELEQDLELLAAPETLVAALDGARLAPGDKLQLRKLELRK